MKWLTISQIKRRSKTAKGALKVSYEHWNQLYTATAKELRKKYKKNDSLDNSEYCGLCIYNTKKNGLRERCSSCVLSPYCVSPLWHKAHFALMKLYNIDANRENWRAWKRACKALRDKLKELMDEGSKRE